MIKKICAIFILTMLINFSVTNAAPKERFIDFPVFDNAGLLSDNEIQSLTNKIKNVEQKYSVRIGIEFLNTIGNRDISTAARELREQHYSDGINGGIIFLVVMDSRSWYISTDSRMDSRLPSISKISGNIVSSLSNGDYYGACDNYIDVIDSALNYYQQNGATYAPERGFDPVAAMIAVIGGIIISFMVRANMLSGMSNVRPQPSATDYLKRETVKLITNRDIYLFTNIARRPKSSGGGGRSNGGASGGGGGGGHF